MKEAQTGRREDACDSGSGVPHMQFSVTREKEPPGPSPAPQPFFFSLFCDAEVKGCRRGDERHFQKDEEGEEKVQS